MERDISPEERLLALIKGKHKKPPDQVTNQSDSKGPRSETPKRNLVFEPAVLKSLNKYLTAGFILLTSYFIFDILFIKPHKKIQSLISQTSDSMVLRQAKKESVSEVKVKDYSYYSKEIANKKIFGPPSKEERKPSQLSKAEEDISSNLTLVGIIAGENPQAIIEDKKTQKTYYLNKKQSFNGFTIDDISDGKVVLEYEGKKIALFL